MVHLMLSHICLGTLTWHKPEVKLENWATAMKPNGLFGSVSLRKKSGQSHLKLSEMTTMVSMSGLRRKTGLALHISAKEDTIIITSGPLAV